MYFRKRKVNLSCQVTDWICSLSSVLTFDTINNGNQLCFYGTQCWALKCQQGHKLKCCGDESVVIMSTHARIDKMNRIRESRSSTYSGEDGIKAI